MTAVRVRKAGAGDAAAIAVVHVLSWQAAYEGLVPQDYLDGLDPARRRELYIPWMQEIRRFKPSTVSRRFSVAAGFYRTCVIDGVLEHSPAEHVQRPSVPPESPTLSSTAPQGCTWPG